MLGVKIQIDQQSVQEVKKEFVKTLARIQSIGEKHPIKITFDTQELKLLIEALKTINESKIKISKAKIFKDDEVSRQKEYISNLDKMFKLQKQMLNMGVNENRAYLETDIKNLEERNEKLKSNIQSQYLLNQIKEKENEYNVKGTGKFIDVQNKQFADAQKKVELEKSLAEKMSKIKEQFQQSAFQKLNNIEVISFADRFKVKDSISNLDAKTLDELRVKIKDINLELGRLNDKSGKMSKQDKLITVANQFKSRMSLDLENLKKQFGEFIDEKDIAEFNNKLNGLFNIKSAKDMNQTIKEISLRFKEMKSNASWESKGNIKANKDEESTVKQVLSNLNEIHSLRMSTLSLGREEAEGVADRIIKLRGENEELEKKIKNQETLKKIQGIKDYNEKLYTGRVNDKVKAEDEKLINAISTATDKATFSVKKLKDTFGNFVPKKNLDEIEKEINDLGQAKGFKDLQERVGKVNELIYTTRNIAKGLKQDFAKQSIQDNFFDSMFVKLKQITQIMSIAKIATFAFNQIKKGVKDIMDLDSALSELRITLDGTMEQYKEVGIMAQNLSKELGTNVSTVLQVIRVYANLNESIDSVQSKIASTVALANLSELDGFTATDIMQGTIEQFNLESENMENATERIADSLVAISANLSVDFSKAIREISEGIKVSGSSAQEAGFQLEEYEALLGAIIEKTRLPGSQIANALRTIFARISRVTTDEAVSDEDVSKVEKAYKSVGITIRDTNGEFRKTPDILKDLTKVWGSLNNVQKSYIAEQSAGKMYAPLCSNA